MQDLTFESKNVLGGELESCSQLPLTGFWRTGRCDTGPKDASRHVVCARMNRDFLQFSRDQGNDLITPMPDFGFPGLLPGDRWCLCAARWKEAFLADMAPQIIIRATHEAVIEIIDVEILKYFALDLN